MADEPRYSRSGDGRSYRLGRIIMTFKPGHANAG